MVLIQLKRNKSDVAFHKLCKVYTATAPKVPTLHRCEKHNQKPVCFLSCNVELPDPLTQAKDDSEHSVSLRWTLTGPTNQYSRERTAILLRTHESQTTEITNAIR